MASSSKRKADDLISEEGEGDGPLTEKEAKTTDPIIDIVAAGEIKFIQAWKKVDASLAEAGISPCDVYGDNSMKWKVQEDRCVELTLTVGHDTGSRHLYTRYSLHYSSNDKSKNQRRYFLDEEWSDLVVQLKQWLSKLRYDAARERIVNHLKWELKYWTEFLDEIPNDKITVFPEASFKDGRLVLEWDSKRGSIRVDRGYAEEEKGDMDFRITKPSPNPEYSIQVYEPFPGEAIDKIAEWLNADKDDDDDD